MTEVTQLTLGLFNPPHADFADFLGEGNRQPRQSLEAWSVGRAPWCIGLWGVPGTGKSHLLQSAVRRVHEQGRRAMYLPLRELLAHGPTMLDGLHQIDALALDDIEAVAGDSVWEEALFNLYNRCSTAHGRLLFAGRKTPGAIGFMLPDLQSRLTAALIFQLDELNDADKLRVLQAIARTRGIELSEQVTSFLIRRLPRQLHDLIAALDLLDQASLQAGRPLTVPFVREVLRTGLPPA